MSTFDVAFVIAAGGFALTVWVLLFADTLHPFLDRMGRAIVRALARIRDRKVRAAADKWALLHPGYVEVPDDLPAAARRINHRTAPTSERN